MMEAVRTSETCLYQARLQGAISHKSVILIFNSLNFKEFEISSSHGGQYKSQESSGCIAVFLIECRHPIKNRAVHPRRL
jgi:hypothetical protein